MSDQDFPPCRWQRPGGKMWRQCAAPVFPYASVSREVWHGHCANCPIPPAEAELRKRIVERIESMMTADGPQAYTRERVLAIVEEELT